MRTLLMLVLMLTGVAIKAADQDAQAILSASDRVRSPDFSFVLTAKLVEYRKGVLSDSSTLLVYSRPNRASGQFDTIVSFVEPARDAGKVMLKKGDDLWLYDPDNKASTRISPRQRLLGQAANGDVITVNWAKDYLARTVAREEILDGEKQKKDAYHLELIAQSPDVTYYKIQLWIEAGLNHPLKAQFYSESDRLLKTAFYRHYEKRLGEERPTETVIVDGLDPHWVTVMQFSDYSQHDVPDAWLQRDYLPHFKVD